jgi:hypothetical protein
MKHENKISVDILIPTVSGNKSTGMFHVDL